MSAQLPIYKLPYDYLSGMKRSYRDQPFYVVSEPDRIRVL